MTDIIQIPTFKCNRRSTEPMGIVVHYSGSRYGGSMEQRVRTWAAAKMRKSSTDFMVARNPKQEPTCQMVHPHKPEFSWYTWHSGGSECPQLGPYWSTRTNEALIGIDLDNYGFLQLIGGEWCQRRLGFNAPSSLDHRRLKGDKAFEGPVYVDGLGRGWEDYTEAQVAEFIRVAKYAWAATEKVAIVGHEQIRSTKSDPGRAFDRYWPDVLAELESA